jgi:hypothetical protein
LTTHTRSRSPASRQVSEQGEPISRLNGFEKWPECSTTRPMPSQTLRTTRSTTASATSPWARWPHHSSTSVAARRDSGRPCSGCSSVAVSAAMPASAASAPAIVPWMPFG